MNMQGKEFYKCKSRLKLSVTALNIGESK